ncbi:MAG: tRNA threonylcarbamoyladenosine dehydratase [Clostridia bacterium]|nr:tRNA threonylcarbamoyladenosine dehydratase [Clostridia bacterium]
MAKIQHERTESLIGAEAMKKLGQAKVLIFGLGGVGGYVVEALARSGIGQIDLVDGDVIDETNINRQLIATHKNIGESKVSEFAKRIHDIDPDIVVNEYNCFYLPDKQDMFNWEQYDYIVDAVDTVTAKIDIIRQAKGKGLKVISSMGTGNKLDPSQFKITDISKTKVCPLAKVVRKKLKEEGIQDVKVLYSEEIPVETESKTPASISFVPSVAGLLIAREIIKDIIGDK